MLLPVILFVLFAIFSTVGAYLVVAHHRGRGVATAAAAATLAFFVLLFWWISVLIQEAGLP
jgi:apolipoprotein N-acyltransferase